MVGIIYGTSTIPPTIALLVSEPRVNLGSMLIDRFVERVKIQLPNATEVRTSLPTDIPEFIAFYSSKGFVVVGFVKGGLQGRDVVHLQKTLTHQSRSII